MNLALLIIGSLLLVESLYIGHRLSSMWAKMEGIGANLSATANKVGERHALTYDSVCHLLDRHYSSLRTIIYQEFFSIKSESHKKLSASQLDLHDLKDEIRKLMSTIRKDQRKAPLSEDRSDD